MDACTSHQVFVYLCSGNADAYAWLYSTVCMCTYDLLVIYFDSTMHDAHVLCINIVLVLLYMYIIIPVLLVYVWLVIWCNPCEFILMLHKPNCALAVHILSVYIYCPYLSFHYICMLSSKTIYMPVTST